MLKGHKSLECAFPVEVALYTTFGVLFLITLGCMMCPRRNMPLSHAFAERLKTRYTINADPGLSRRTRNVSHDIEEAQKTQVKVKVALAQEEHVLDWSSRHACDRGCRNVPTSLLPRCPSSKYNGNLCCVWSVCLGCFVRLRLCCTAYLTSRVILSNIRSRQYDHPIRRYDHYCLLLSNRRKSLVCCSTSS